MLANLTFFATGLVAQDDGEQKTQGGLPRVTNVRFESLEFAYPSVSRRAIGDLGHVADGGAVVWTNLKEGKDLAWTNHTFVDCRWRFADTEALQFQGSGGSFDNCMWEWNSWSSRCSSTPVVDDGNCGTLVVEGLPPPGDAAQFSRLTFSNNGASKCLRPGSSKDLDHPVRITDVLFETQLQLADDGCFVETGGPHAAHMEHNWMHGSGKSALRFDGTFASGTAHGAMVSNVGFNVSSLEIKGDVHTIANNTIFDASDIGASWAMHSRPRYQDPTSPLGTAGGLDGKACSATVENAGANTHSTFSSNLFDRVDPKDACAPGAKSCPFAGAWTSSNLVGAAEGPGWNGTGGSTGGTTPTVTPFRIRSQLRDPYYHDFRPCPGSLAAKLGAGAYPVFAATDTTYRLPGARGQMATGPIPGDGAIDVITDTDLIFRAAFRAVGHTVLLGSTPGSLEVLATLAGDGNIAHPPPAVVQPSGLYYWRVDAHFGDGSSRSGAVWGFTAGTATSCPPQPAPPPPPTIPPACDKALIACCSDVEGTGGRCIHTIARHARKDPSGFANCTHANENLFCGI